MWLGHHSPAFTLATYVHLLPDDLAVADFLDALTGGQQVGNQTDRDKPAGAFSFFLVRLGLGKFRVQHA